MVQVTIFAPLYRFTAGVGTIKILILNLNSMILKSLSLSSKCLLPLLSVAILSSCINSKRIDKFIAGEYNNELPAVKKKTELAVNTGQPASGSQISVTSYKMEQFLPLLVYWQSKERYTIKLNPSIAANNFSNALNGSAGRPLLQKLNGQQLELNLEQVPSQFSLAANGYMIWLVYAFTWEKAWIEPDRKDLVVNYTLHKADGSTKTGKVTVKNPVTEKQELRYFQSWRSAISEHLSDYNTAATTVTKSFVTKMLEELQAEVAVEKPLQ